jgi:SAM-dependent methyltransferase
MPAPWQRWLYRAKERAYRRLLDEQGVAVRGRRVLDFGCGAGYFEDVWERAGATTTVGVDVVPATIERLAAEHPRRSYVCADLSSAPEALDPLGDFDLVTAIDVVYHILDDERLERTLAALVKALRPAGHFLFTDALREHEPQSHVRFRSLAWWRRQLDTHGFSLVARRPVAVLHNRPSRAGKLAPALVGALAYHADSVLLRVAPSLANNWAVLARRVQTSSS